MTRGGPFSAKAFSPRLAPRGRGAKAYGGSAFRKARRLRGAYGGSAFRKARRVHGAYGGSAFRKARRWRGAYGGSASTLCARILTRCGALPVVVVFD